MSDRTDTYLDQVTAGLQDDAELRLDVRAELASHLEDKAAELQRQGAPADTSHDQAIAALGEPADVATQLALANRRRLNRRAWLRRGLRFALVPAAVVVAILCSDLQLAEALQTVQTLRGGPAADAVLRWLPRPPAWRALPDPRDEVPLLKATPRELWESEPGNRIYYAEFVTHDVDGSRGGTEEQQRPFLAILETARTLDPANARYDYWRADIVLGSACEVKADKQPRYTYGERGIGTLSWEIKDRALLDQAMATLLGGLRKSEFHRYGQEMLRLKLAAMGEADRLLPRLRRIAVTAAVWLTDLARLRELARAACLYGDLLAQEGRVEEARPFLDAWKTLTVQLNADSWCFIDCIVVTSLTNGIPEHSARVYDRLGLAADAARTRREGEALGGPGLGMRAFWDDWSRKGVNKGQDCDLVLYGGVLTNALLPGVGRTPTRQECDASRRAEYTLAMQAVLSLLSAGLLVAMLACLVVSLRWRFLSDGAAIPILLLPDGRRVLRILALGVLLPLALFAGVVLFVPISGQCYSAQAAMHRVLAEFLLLAIAILMVPAWLAVREAGRRCRELGIAYDHSGAAWGLVPLLLGAAAVAVVWWVPPRPKGPPEACLVIIGGTALILVVTALAAALFLLLAKRSYGLYCGTVARSLIPIFAAAVVLLCATARPWLLRAERHYIAADTVLALGPHDIGLSRMENQLTECVRKAVAEAAASLNKN